MTDASRWNFGCTGIVIYYRTAPVAVYLHIKLVFSMRRKRRCWLWAPFNNVNICSQLPNGARPRCAAEMTPMMIMGAIWWQLDDCWSIPVHPRLYRDGVMVSDRTNGCISVCGAQHPSVPETAADYGRYLVTASIWLQFKGNHFDVCLIKGPGRWTAKVSISLPKE